MRGTHLPTLMLAAILFSLLLSYPSVSTSAQPSHGKLQHLSFTLYDYAYVVLTRNRTTAYFEIPTNYSDGTLNQTVYIVAYGGDVTLVGNDSNVTAQIKVFNGSYGFVVVRIKQTFLNLTSVVLEISRNPKAFADVEDEIPQGIREKYVKKPVDIIKRKVVPDFTKWLKERGYSINNVSKAFLAVQAAIFIYLSGYIRYNASALPRTLADIVNKHQGDCDDMSRVLMNLLWYYGIPAKMEYSYVYLPLNMTMPIEGSYMRFLNAGPHAYTLMYIPTVGWVSLDFLAGARLNNPSLVEGESLTAEITEKQLEHAKKELSRIRYAEEVMLFKDSEIPSKLRTYNVSKLATTLHDMLLPLIKKVALEAGLNITSTATSSTMTQSSTTVTGTNTSTPENRTGTSSTTTLVTTQHTSTTSTTPSSTATYSTQETTCTTSRTSTPHSTRTTSTTNTSTPKVNIINEPDFLGFLLLLILLVIILARYAVKASSGTQQVHPST